jgi:hypothetical protein
MAQLSQRPVIIWTRENSGEGMLYLQHLESQQRLIRAAKIWALMWALMVLSLPLMIIHFILVPGFLIAGPVMAVRRYNTLEVPHHLDGHCPACKQDMTMPASSLGRLPMSAQCPACKVWLNLQDKK